MSLVQARKPRLTPEAMVAQRFDDLAERFPKDLAPDDVRLGAIWKALDSKPGLRILDLGCGQGRFGRALLDRGMHVVGLDRSRTLIRQARQLHQVVSGAARLPFPSQSFDAIICVEVLEHIQDIRKHLFTEWCRVLKPSGQLLILDKSLLSLHCDYPFLPAILLKWVDQWRGRWMYRLGETIRERWFIPERLGQQLGHHFDQVEIRSILHPDEADHWIFRRWSWTRRFVLWSARRPGGSNS